MTPPEAPVAGSDARPAEPPPAVSVCLEVMKRRADFLAAARARRQVTPGFIVQGRARDDGRAGVRVGFTASKKVGNAVARNRARRRLREVARAVLPRAGRPGWDYVLIARRDTTATRNLDAMKNDLTQALRRLNR